MPACYKVFNILPLFYDMEEGKIAADEYRYNPNKLYSLGPVINTAKCVYNVGEWNYATNFYPNSKIFAYMTYTDKNLKDEITSTQEIWYCEYENATIFNNRCIPSQEYELEQFWNNFKADDEHYYYASRPQFSTYITGRNTILVDAIKPIEKVLL